MIENFMANINNFINQNIIGYWNELYQYPIKLVPILLDLAIITFFGVKLLKLAKDSRVMQLIKGIIFFMVITWVSGIFGLPILHGILTSFLPYGVIALVIIFQPEIRRALEQLGTNKITSWFGIDKDLATKTKEDIYKIVIAVEELAKTRTGGLIVLERDIKIKDIIDTGILMNADVSPQLLVNLFVPKTPLHDGAVIISNNKIVSAACILPLAGDKDIAKALGTRHRAGIGISKESDAIAIVVSEESGKISIAKDGTLIVDVNGEVLKKILIKHVVTNRLENRKENTIERLKNKRKQEKTKQTMTNSEMEASTEENKEER